VALVDRAGGAHRLALVVGRLGDGVGGDGGRDGEPDDAVDAERHEDQAGHDQGVGDPRGRRILLSLALRLLAVEALTSLLQAGVLVEDWRIEYNTVRLTTTFG
jgi:hypothetical protein